jgi:23S rRNA (pseudouridine1915-N3)-methyltransferase
MRIRIFWVGKTKEGFLVEGVRRYLERLEHLAECEVVELREEKGVPREAALREEGERILKRAGSYTLLDEKGVAMSSPEFASFLKDRSRLEFVLGGAYGVSDDVRSAAAATVALSRMTFTHEMARLVLLEQLYRAFMINAGRSYHH